MIPSQQRKYRRMIRQTERHCSAFGARTGASQALQFALMAPAIAVSASAGPERRKQLDGTPVNIMRSATPGLCIAGGIW